MARKTPDEREAEDVEVGRILLPRILPLNRNTRWGQEEPRIRTELWFARWTRDTLGNGDFDEDGYFVVACGRHERLDVPAVAELIKGACPHEFAILRFKEVKFVAVPNWVTTERG